jgi:ribonuclease-3
LIKRLFLLTSKRPKDELHLIRFIIERFGYRPKNLLYFKKAITHKSYLTKSERLVSNERLEFLGDSIIGSVISEWLYHRFPHEDEGYLTQLKSKIVSRKVLSDIAEKLELRNIILYQTGRSININSIEGNTLEAIFGAIYLDGGFVAAKNSILHHVFRKYIDVKKLLSEDTDYKSKLFITCQRNRWELEFRSDQEMPAKSYDITVYINNEKYGTGSGTTKKEAEQEASRTTLALLDQLGS